MLRRSTILPLLTAFVMLLGAEKPARAQGRPDAAEQPARKLTKPPRLVQFVEAEYPEAEKGNPREASVVLEIAISATGAVEEAQVKTSAGPHFDAAALEAVRRFQFEPAEIDNAPAPVRITYEYRFTVKVEAPTTAEYKGRVVEKSTGNPLPGVNVAVAGLEPVVTDEEGRFSFSELPPGAHQVRLWGPDLIEVQTEEQLEAGKQLDVRYELELRPEDESEDSDDLEIVIVAPKLTKQAVSTEVAADKARRVPGTQGDVLKIVENMPGVSRASAGSGAVVVWGAAPEDTRTYVGSVRVPMLYHFGGLRAVVHPDTVASVELLPGGYGAAYGRGLGGIVLVDTRAPASDAFHTNLRLDVLDASARVTGPISEKVSFDAAARRGHLADLVGLYDDGDKSYQSFFTIPEYYEGAARVRYRLGDGEHMELGGMLSSDRQEREAPSADPSERESDTRELRFERVSFRYERDDNAGTTVMVEPWVGRDRSARIGEFGGVKVESESQSYLVGTRAEYRRSVSEEVGMLLGFDFEFMRTDSSRDGTQTQPPREGDPYIFGRPPGDQTNTDDWVSQIWSAAPYLELDVTPFGPDFHIIPGLRVEPYVLAAERRRPAAPGQADLGVYTFDIAVQPRLAARWAVSPQMTLTGAVGGYRQPPAPEDLSSVFGNPLLTTSRGTQYTAGASYQLWSSLSFATTAFYSRSRELSVRNPDPTPTVAESLIQTGEGRSMGTQFMLTAGQQSEQGFFGWIAYTLSRSERRSSPDAEWRLFDYDQTHVFTALAAYALGGGWDVGTRLRAATGYPRTPVTGAYYNTFHNRYEPILGDLNSTRIPPFFQADVRGSKVFTFDATKLEVYAEIQNVTYRENPEEIAYSEDYSEKSYISGLRILPVVGASLEF